MCLARRVLFFDDFMNQITNERRLSIKFPCVPERLENETAPTFTPSCEKSAAVPAPAQMLHKCTSATFLPRHTDLTMHQSNHLTVAVSAQRSARRTDPQSLGGADAVFAFASVGGPRPLRPRPPRAPALPRPLAPLALLGPVAAAGGLPPTCSHASSEPAAEATAILAAVAPAKPGGGGAADRGAPTSRPGGRSGGIAAALRAAVR